MDKQEEIRLVQGFFQNWFPVRLEDGRLAWYADKDLYQNALAGGCKGVEREEAIREWVER